MTTSKEELENNNNNNSLRYFVPDQKIEIETYKRVCDIPTYEEGRARGGNDDYLYSLNTRTKYCETLLINK